MQYQFNIDVVIAMEFIAYFWEFIFMFLVLNEMAIKYGDWVESAE